MGTNNQAALVAGPGWSLKNGVGHNLSRGAGSFAPKKGLWSCGHMSCLQPTVNSFHEHLFKMLGCGMLYCKGNAQGGQWIDHLVWV